MNHPTSLGLDGLRDRYKITIAGTYMRSLILANDSEIDQWTTFDSQWLSTRRSSQEIIDDIKSLISTDFRLRILLKESIGVRTRGPTTNVVAWKARLHFKSKDDALLVKLTYVF